MMIRLSGAVVIALLYISTVGIPTAQAKEIVKDAVASENKVFIRTDGLACYFCAYGLERFFKKTGRIAAFDMNMEEGIVEVTLIEGQPLVSAADLNRYVHDAGFSPRWIKVDLVGRFVREGDRLFLDVADTKERVPVSESELARNLPQAAFDNRMRIEARAVEDESAPFALELEKFQPA